MNTLVKAMEKEYEKKKVQFFKVGDTIKVFTRVVEGDKERVQVYNGIVVARRGQGTSETFTVTRVACGYANEKIFPLHSPSIEKIEVVSRGDVRKSKLSYLRGVVGKKAKVTAKIGAFGALYENGNDEEVMTDETT